MRFIATLFSCLAVASGFASASAETCPGNPDALGTSRILTISPSKFSQVGSMQYKQTLPLNDHEVVITFDDGPLPPYRDIILDIFGVAMCEGHLFPGRPDGECLSVPRAAHLQRGPYHRHPQPGPPARFPAAPIEADYIRGRRRHCFGH